MRCERKQCGGYLDLRIVVHVCYILGHGRLVVLKGVSV
jgi:hypothetical protein